MNNFNKNNITLPDEIQEGIQMVHNDNKELSNTLVSSNPEALNFFRTKVVTLIKFSNNMQQPSTEVAKKYSEANEKNEEITDRYTNVSEVTPHKNINNPTNNDYVKAGYNKNRNSKKIINFASKYVQKNRILDEIKSSESNSQEKEQFIKNFRKIVLSRVGKILLYRLLVGIKIYNVTADVKQPKEDKCQKNSCRCIFTKHENIGFKYEKGVIQFYNQKVNTYTIDKKHLYLKPDKKSYPHIPLFNGIPHCTHHFNINQKLTLSENKVSDEKRNNTLLNRMGEIYYTDIPDYNAMPNYQKMKTTNEYYFWQNSDGNISFEETMTILGSTKSNGPNYLERDNLCKNLYRFNNCCNSRYIYKSFNDLSIKYYKPDKIVLNGGINSC